MLSAKRMLFIDDGNTRRGCVDDDLAASCWSRAIEMAIDYDAGDTASAANGFSATADDAVSGDDDASATHNSATIVRQFEFPLTDYSCVLFRALRFPSFRPLFLGLSGSRGGSSVPASLAMRRLDLVAAASAHDCHPPRSRVRSAATPTAFRDAHDGDDVSNPAQLRVRLGRVGSGRVGGRVQPPRRLLLANPDAGHRRRRRRAAVALHRDVHGDGERALLLLGGAAARRALSRAARSACVSFRCTAPVRPAGLSMRTHGGARVTLGDARWGR